MIIRNLYQFGELVTNNILHGYKLNQLTDLIKSYNNEDWQTYIDKYDIDKIVVYQNFVIQIILMRWNKDQMTKINKYSSYGTIMKVLDGSMIEEVYKLDAKDNLQFEESKDLLLNNCSGKNQYQYVKYICNDDEAITLHIMSINDEIGKSLNI